MSLKKNINLNTKKLKLQQKILIKLNQKQRLKKDKYFQ